MRPHNFFFSDFDTGSIWLRLLAQELELPPRERGSPATERERRLAEFLLDQTLPTSVVGCDNESTLKSLRRRDLTARNRHVRVYLGFILDAIDSNEIRFEHRVSHLNEANTLTKAEDDVTFLRSLIKLAGLPPNYKLQAASRTD